jgi:hypothetical protein
MTDLKPFKPCPFCGKESGRYGWVMLAELNKVKCNYCGAESRSGDGPEAWNTRPIEDKLKDRVRELEAKEDRFDKLIEADKGHVLHRAIVNLLERDALKAWAELDEWIAAGRLVIKLDEGCRDMIDYMNTMEKIVPLISALLAKGGGG